MIAAPQAFLANSIISIAGSSDGVKAYGMKVDHGDPMFSRDELATDASIAPDRPIYSFAPEKGGQSKILDSQPPGSRAAVKNL